MPEKWKEVTKLTFKGSRFNGHALDLLALEEIRQYMTIVEKTTKALWRARNSGKNLPAHFEERLRFCVRKIGPGSAVVPIEVALTPGHAKNLFGDSTTEAEVATEMALEAYSALEREQPLPTGFPKELLKEYGEFGRSLHEGEEIEIALPAAKGKRQKRVSVSPRTLVRLSQFEEPVGSTTTEITGEVQEADVRRRRFQVWIDGATAVSADFTEAQEELVTSALKEHRSVKLRLRGRVVLSGEGKPVRFTEVDAISLVRAEESNLFSESRPIEDVIASIVADVPASEWERVPPDLSTNLDHYLYGAPKKCP